MAPSSESGRVLFGPRWLLVSTMSGNRRSNSTDFGPKVQSRTNHKAIQLNDLELEADCSFSHYETHETGPVSYQIVKLNVVKKNTLSILLYNVQLNDLA